MKRNFILFGMLSSVGCVLEPGSLIEIVNAPQADLGGCVFRVGTPNLLSKGVFDATLAENFRLGLVLRNYLAGKDYDAASLEGSLDAPLKPEANGATLIGFDTCFYREDDPNLDISVIQPKGTALVDCGSLPVEQRRFIAANANIPPGGADDAIAEIGVLRLDDLQVDGLFGPDFEPAKLGFYGARWEDTNGSGQTGDADDDIIYHFKSPPPELNSALSPPRNPAWGAYPESRIARVLIQATAQLKLQTGIAIRSNEFTFPIQLETGMALDVCGRPPTLQQCVTVCGGNPCPTTLGSLVQQRECVINTPSQCGSECPPLLAGLEGELCRPFAFIGSRPDITARCLVSQGGHLPTCVNWNACEFGK